MFALRDYQHLAIDEVRQAVRAAVRRIVLVAPTGSGKTVIAAQVVKLAADKGRRVMFLAHRRELVNQCADKLISFGVDHGILMAGEYPYGAADCQVASIDTLRARCITTNKLPLPHADVIVVDEAHRSLAPTYLKIIDAYPKAVVIGLTATPIRGDGKGLGHVYDHMVTCPSITELTRMGHLVPTRTFAPTIPDLTGVKIKKGDYDERQLAKAMDHRSLVGDIVTHWHRLASDRPTIVFASGVKHSMHLRDEFLKSGVAAAHVDGDTPIPERQQIVDDLNVGKIQVVSNYGVFTEGFDEPKLSACVLARPTKHLGLYMQMAGRTLRPFADKEDSLIIDHSGNVYEHGFISDERNWVLEEGRALLKTNKERQKEFDEREPITCVKCATVYTGQLPCPHCGHIPEKKGKYVETRHGELMEVRAEKRRTAKNREWSEKEKQEWYSMFLHYQRKHKYKLGWVAAKFNQKFQHYPEFRYKAIPVEPSDECLSWIRAMNIRYAKGKEAAEKRDAERKQWEKSHSAGG